MSTLIAGRILHQQPSHASKDCPRVSRWLAVLLSRLHALLMRRYFKIEVTGEHNIPSSGPFILAPLHRSRWDAFMLYCAVTRRFLYFMVSHDEVVGLQGWFMRRMGVFPVNTQRPSPTVIRSSKELISRGDSLVVFPEGNLFYYGPGEVHPLKPGVAWMALNFQKALVDMNLVIIPVRLVYGDRRLRWGSRAKIVVGEPISVSDYSALPRKEGVAALTTTLQNILGEVVNETSSAESLRQCD
ncbi:lysophospholipid acyltransferase family protein [Paludisphaera soli]|uniref:lysophospholipid acyltransferase family protein n=1 Tax=Paludisphaera soli TaxID=2712865 RepID=UPI0013EB07E5|nr:1-acyl-sn-glycerol-3-phosphate acyltransferase [Paludisphaera soli]